jgi:HEPN domain-containing protein
MAHSPTSGRGSKTKPGSDGCPTVPAPDGDSMSREPIKAIRRIVQAGSECCPKSYRRAATQRLDVARFLLENSKYYLDALYLAGYVVECSLKALILERTPKSKWAAVCEEIGSGAKAHNLDFLAGILNRGQGSIPDEAAESLDVIKREWIQNLRYVGAIIPYVEAKNFIEHVVFIYHWAERST